MNVPSRIPTHVDATQDDLFDTNMIVYHKASQSMSNNVASRFETM